MRRAVRVIEVEEVKNSKAYIAFGHFETQDLRQVQLKCLDPTFRQTFIATVNLDVVFRILLRRLVDPADRAKLLYLRQLSLLCVSLSHLERPQSLFG